MAELLYLDSSAIVKLVVEEPESIALRQALASRPHRVSSALALVEVGLAATRRRPAPPAGRVRQVLAGLVLIPIDQEVLETAAALRHPNLPALDAIHLATAQSLGADLDCLIAYDQRLIAGAHANHVTAAQPI